MHLRHEIMKNDEPEYRPLDLAESDENAHGPIRPRSSILRVIIWVQIANFLAFGLLYALWRTPRDMHHWGYDGMPLKYNTSRTFTVDKNDLSFVRSSPKADKYWMSITKDRRNGLVSISLDWARKHSLKPSAQKTKSGETVFSVDMFHQLHCLERIRGHIISAKYMYQLNPNRSDDDAFARHTLHCVDYLRQAIMCAGDMTLVSTGKDIEFDHGPARQCRDFDAISSWVSAHKWDYETFLNGQ